MTGADVDSAFDRRTAGQTEGTERQSLSLPAAVAAAAGDIQSNCLKNAIKMYDKKERSSRWRRNLKLMLMLENKQADN